MLGKMIAFLTLNVLMSSSAPENIFEKVCFFLPLPTSLGSMTLTVDDMAVVFTQQIRCRPRQTPVLKKLT